MQSQLPENCVSTNQSLILIHTWTLDRLVGVIPGSSLLVFLNCCFIMPRSPMAVTIQASSNSVTLGLKIEYHDICIPRLRIQIWYTGTGMRCSQSISFSAFENGLVTYMDKINCTPSEATRKRRCGLRVYRSHSYLQFLGRHDVHPRIIIIIIKTMWRFE